MSSLRDVETLSFSPAFMERIWGGQRLRTVLGLTIPRDKNVGEAWLVSDHPVHESVVDEGPLAGTTLRQLMVSEPEALLGSRAKPTPGGRFPLLLKILDARDILSVQVHPDDDTAARLQEPDAGKTEMWHVWDAEPGSHLICGLSPGTDRDILKQAIAEGTLEDYLVRFPVEPGDSVYVPAGTVHAIGAGVLLSEIQQNSDLTYRLYDYNRRDANGILRDLHVEKSLEATHFDHPHRGPAKATVVDTATELASSEYFTCSLIKPGLGYSHDTGNRSFTILLPKADGTLLRTPSSVLPLQRARAVLIPAHVPAFTLEGPAPVLLHFVP